MPDLETLYTIGVHNPRLLAALVLIWACSALLNFAIAHRSQIDEWCEERPRVAGVLKIFRALGLDPWGLAQGITLIVKGRFPLSLEKAKAAVQAPRSTLRPPPITMLCLGLFVLLGVSTGCSGTPPRPQYVADLVPQICRVALALVAPKVSDAEAARICKDARLAAKLAATVADAAIATAEEAREQEAEKPTEAEAPSVDAGAGGAP